jgi:hypothetical protein
MKLNSGGCGGEQVFVLSVKTSFVSQALKVSITLKTWKFLN